MHGGGEAMRLADAFLVLVGLKDAVPRKGPVNAVRVADQPVDVRIVASTPPSVPSSIPVVDHTIHEASESRKALEHRLKRNGFTRAVEDEMHRKTPRTRRKRP
jgi:hypothetical protein